MEKRQMQDKTMQLVSEASEDIHMNRQSNTTSASSIENIANQASESSASTSLTVTESFNRSDRENSAESQLVKEHLQHVKEKLETSLVEMQNGTSKKFVSMLVEAQQNANYRKAERRRLCQGLIADVDKYTMERLKDLEKRHEEFDQKEEQFLKNIKQKGEEVIREHYEQTRAVLQLQLDNLLNLLKQTPDKN